MQQQKEQQYNNNDNNNWQQVNISTNILSQQQITRTCSYQPTLFIIIYSA